MEFTFDVSQTPLIGRRILLKSESSSTQNLHRSNQQSIYLAHNIVGTPISPRRSASLSPADTAPLSGWKRPWMSQGRVRECLVNLLTTCGQRVGLPKSPSVSAIYFLKLKNVGECMFLNKCQVTLIFLLRTYLMHVKIIQKFCWFNKKKDEINLDRNYVCLFVVYFFFYKINCFFDDNIY